MIFNDCGMVCDWLKKITEYVKQTKLSLFYYFIELLSV